MSAMARKPSTGKQIHPNGPKISLTPAERKAVRIERERQKLTGLQLAVKAGTTQGTISNIETKNTQVYAAVYASVLRALKHDGAATDAASQEIAKRAYAGLATLDSDEMKVVIAQIELIRSRKPV